MLTLFVSRVRIENVIFFTFRLTFLHLNLSIMSWQSYVDDQLLATKVVKVNCCSIHFTILLPESPEGGYLRS